MNTRDWLSVASILISIVALLYSLVHYYQDKKRESRRFFTTTLWDKVASLNEVDSHQPIGPDVKNAVNALLAVAMCWEADTVDRDMVVLGFGELYETLYQQIYEVTVPVPGYRQTGREMLAQHRVIGAIRDEIQRKLNERAKMP